MVRREPPRIDGPTSPPTPAPALDTAPAPDPCDISSAAYDAAPGDGRKWLPANAMHLLGSGGLPTAAIPQDGTAMEVERVVSNAGLISLANKQILVSETTLAIHLADHDDRTIRRTTTQPIRNIKADRPRTVPSVS